ncbi:MAG TPA: shikimate dehydrogenase [Actinomycetota bacterium]
MSTALYAVMGWPVVHSASPAIHTAAFDTLGIPAVYLRLPVPPGRAAAAIASLWALGARGASVTAPHKVAIAGLCQDLARSARRTGTVNTLLIEEGSVTGHDTDAEGLRRFLLEDARLDLAGLTALVLGGGGAARACAVALSGLAGRLVVAARGAAAGAEVADLFEGPSTVIPFVEAGEAQADLLLNATPLGWRGEDVAVDPRPGQVVVDLVYRETPLLRRAWAVGAVAHDGRGMLLRQAALSFRLWTGEDPPLEAMRAALDGVLTSAD